MTKKEAGWGLVYLLLQLLVLPSVLVQANQLLARPLSSTELNLVFFLVNFLAILAIFHRFLWISLRLGLQRPFPCLKTAFVGFAVYQLSSMLLSMVILKIDPRFANVNDASIALLAQEHFSLMALATVFLVPVVEETLFRGLIFHWLYNRSRTLAFIFSTVLFCTIHVVGYIGEFPLMTLLLCFAQYIPAGLCLGWAYAKSGTIWVPIIIHITVNQIAIFAVR